MIIWINGAFGSGKTTIATMLHEQLGNSYLYDPENVGYYLWQNEPEEIKIREDFQKEPLWREFNYLMLKNIYEKFSGDIIVPMTLVNYDYYHEIVGRLECEGVKIKHFALKASKQTLLNRLEKRGDGADSWAAAQIDRCITAFKSGKFDGIIDTDEKSPEQIMTYILEKINERNTHTS
ncbi:MAG: AAA family ATPase [Clostridia bacterium]|nr:AAA family ATPase [Clostridia bacterium]